MTLYENERSAPQILMHFFNTSGCARSCADFDGNSRADRANRRFCVWLGRISYISQAQTALGFPLWKCALSRARISYGPEQEIFSLYLDTINKCIYIKCTCCHPLRNSGRF